MTSMQVSPFHMERDHAWDEGEITNNDMVAEARTNHQMLQPWLDGNSHNHGEAGLSVRLGAR